MRLSIAQVREEHEFMFVQRLRVRYLRDLKRAEVVRQRARVAALLHLLARHIS